MDHPRPARPADHRPRTAGEGQGTTGGAPGQPIPRQRTRVVRPAASEVPVHRHDAVRGLWRRRGDLGSRADRVRKRAQRGHLHERDHHASSFHTSCSSAQPLAARRLGRLVGLSRQLRRAPYDTGAAEIQLVVLNDRGEKFGSSSTALMTRRLMGVRDQSRCHWTVSRRADSLPGPTKVLDRDTIPVAGELVRRHRCPRTRTRRSGAGASTWCGARCRWPPSRPSWPGSGCAARWSSGIGTVAKVFSPNGVDIGRRLVSAALA
jgi:hypothetical protein